mmetsp:Transcript_24894/g.62614  ORF Transcript_24894/g.62614 Transcript_24894/m.62614 type:complete len:217 (+) Transcript_24894:183-833(+)|eukprot:g3313.t1
MIKIVFAGDANVGKTALFQKWKTNETLFDTEATIAIECERRKLQLVSNCRSGIPDNIDEVAETREVIVQLWDTAGQEKFQSVSTHQYRNTKGALLVYDVNQPDTLASLEKRWRPQVLESAGDDVVIAIVANKCDAKGPSSAIGSGTAARMASCAEAEACISRGRKLADVLPNCLFFETSSRWERDYYMLLENNECGIEKVVEALAAEIARRVTVSS